MDIFEKPWIHEWYLNKKQKCIHPYPKELFKQVDIFPLFLLDGGAFFFLKDHLEGAADSNAILKGIESGKLFELWTNQGIFNWKMPYEQFKTKKDKPWEWIVWINRLYFLLPLAQEFYRTGDEKWADSWYKYFDDWSQHNTYEPYDNTENHKTSLIWRDMQVCWRFLVLIHSVYLLSSSLYLDKTKWKKIYYAIELHANHVYQEAIKQLSTGKSGGNHFQQKGLVLLYAGILFPEFEKAEQYILTGKQILEKHLADQMYKDGGNAEASPSYSHFIARMYVEAFLLLQKHNIPGIIGLEESIQRQYYWLYQASSTLGQSLQINDSYALDVNLDLNIVTKIFPLTIPVRKESILFDKSKFSVIRNNLYEVFIDAMPQKEYHQHFGRPNILVYFNGLPLIIDAGCCNYDRNIKHEYFQRSCSHNVVVVPEFEDSFSSCDEMLEHLQNHSKIEITNFILDQNEASITILHTIGHNDVNFTWQRQVILKNEKLKIIDRIESIKEIQCRQLFHFAPNNMILSADKMKAFITLNTHEVVIKHEKKNCQFDISYQIAMDGTNNITYSPTLSSTLKSTICEFEVIISKEM
ncbi:MAG: hypothetical protein A2Y15_03760 [Clostridiales bacterium GWF2_36_10]|nr:MAG: hypothetical protein A2Y15_03760 [Clostridiales bacterium GWF2_36_10]HAN22103.1 hypothetical protein [Clostridiales bacterium]